MIMKALPLVALLALASCAHTPPKVPGFKRKEVCSASSLEYLTKNKKNYSRDNAKAKDYAWSLIPKIQSCYKKAMANALKPAAFNLCFVTGYDKKGKRDFVEFSTQQYTLSPELKQCLDKVAEKKAKGLKNVTFLQPYRLSPKM
jgi:outer membrane protein OmpA-like peptidoglycan-associated protein